MVCRIRASVCLTSLVMSLILPGPSPPLPTPVWLPDLSAGSCMFPSRHCGFQPFSVGGDETILSLTPRHRWDENPSLNPPLFPSFQVLISLFLPFHSLVQVYQLLPYSNLRSVFETLHYNVIHCVWGHQLSPGFFKAGAINNLSGRSLLAWQQKKKKKSQMGFNEAACI